MAIVSVYPAILLVDDVTVKLVLPNVPVLDGNIFRFTLLDDTERVRDGFTVTEKSTSSGLVAKTEEEIPRPKISVAGRIYLYGLFISLL